MKKTSSHIGIFVIIILVLCLPLTPWYHDFVRWMDHSLPHHHLKVIFFVILYIAAMLVPYWPSLTLLAGSLFSFKTALVIAIAAPILGNSTAYLIGVLFAKSQWIENAASKMGDKRNIFNTFNLVQLWLLFASPIFPTRILNYCFHIFKLRYWRYVIAMGCTVIYYAIPTLIIGRLNQGHFTFWYHLKSQLTRPSLIISYIAIMALVILSTITTIYLFSKRLTKK